MSEVSTQTKKVKKVKKESSFIILLKGIGCFFVLSFLFIIFIIILGIYFIGPTVSAIKLEEKLPAFDGPTDHDYWSLQEKFIDLKKDEENINYVLTHGEFNALLSSIRVPPVSAFCLNKVRHSYNNKELRYYLIGSGYTLKKLVISFVLMKESDNYYPSEIKINSFKVSGNSWLEGYIKDLINTCASSDKSGLLSKILIGKVQPKFSD